MIQFQLCYTSDSTWNGNVNPVDHQAGVCVLSRSTGEKLTFTSCINWTKWLTGPATRWSLSVIKRSPTLKSFLTSALQSTVTSDLPTQDWRQRDRFLSSVCVLSFSHIELCFRRQLIITTCDTFNNTCSNKCVLLCYYWRLQMTCKW